jgi:glycosyltransferase involved in cell wall biosynthesis
MRFSGMTMHAPDRSLAVDSLMPIAKTPLLPEVGLLAMPYHHFDSSWMTPHHLLTRLASYFQVIWLEPAHHWREAPDLNDRQQTIEQLTHKLPPSFHVYVPEPWLPDVYRLSWLRHLLLCARVRRGWRRLEGLGCSTRVLYLWHYQFEPAFAVHRQDLSLYHIEDEYSFAREPPPMDLRELKLLREVDQVFVHSPQLMERKGWINPNTAFVPNGVDYRLYSTAVPEPRDIASIPHPRIGYTGNLKTQLDWRLLRDVATRRPEWSFVFVGPRLSLTAEDRALLDEMSRRKNVYLLGEKSVKALAAYPQHFDVCIMPYVLNGYTQNIYPLKLHEYLASGRPVVGSPIRSLKDFHEVIALASSADEWCEALASALTPAAGAPAAAAARQNIARQYDWSELTYTIARTICERLNPELVKRIEKVTIDTPDITYS